MKAARAPNNQLYEKVLERVLSGRLVAGAPIRQDALATELGVSKIPLREALTRLESDGLIVSHLNRGFSVCDLSREEADDIFDLRLRLEPDTAALGALNANGSERAAAEEAFTALDKALATGSMQVGRRNREFHLALVRPSGRTVTINIIERLLALSERYVRVHLGPRGRSERARQEHKDLLDAWLARRHARVRTDSEKHIKATLRDLAEQLSPESS
jgi:DNA-binding GntR family transcriptional regulator